MKGITWGERMIDNMIIAFFLSTFAALIFLVLLEYALLRPYQQWSRFFDKADEVFDMLLRKYGDSEEE
jgi:hypothetical protein